MSLNTRTYIEIIYHLLDIDILILIKCAVLQQILHKQFIILKIIGRNNIKSSRTWQKINNIESNNSENFENYIYPNSLNLFVRTNTSKNNPFSS